MIESDSVAVILSTKFGIISLNMPAVGTRSFKTIGPDRILENEAFRIMSSFKVLKPASYNGKNVKINYEIPISFRLD